MKYNKVYILILFSLLIVACSQKEKKGRERINFNKNWKFIQSDNPDFLDPNYDDSDWRILNLPHDWSIEGEFSKCNPTQINGGALPAGIGWYRKSFNLDESYKNKQVFIDFDGVYRNSKVWINGNYLGKRPYGYSSFRYNLTPYLNIENNNVITVRVDNSEQPNSRWYTGSGIYRNVWLVSTGNIYIDHWGTFVTTPEIDKEKATINLAIKLRNSTGKSRQLKVKTSIYNTREKVVANAISDVETNDSLAQINQEFDVKNPGLWSISNPYLYKAITTVYDESGLTDKYETTFGIRSYKFDSKKGFFLNGEYMKIYGVNNHHDLGALGAAVNTRAIERQLEILKDMGCNAIRTAHNPPAPELLDLCDRMGFIVMDEAFDVWAKGKIDQDYHTIWDEWHKRDLQDMVLRDRNHPSVFIWSIGNEIPEQFDSTGIIKGKELVNIVKSLDTTRLVTCALTEQDPKKNFIYQSKALDLISFNYKHREYLNFPKNYSGECMLATENMSAYSTRGHYDMPSDSIRVWPEAYNIPLKGNPDLTASAYDHVHAFWGATHEETWDVVKKHDFISGMFIWSGFDFIGEPEPYPWPARSSYYGIIDLCGFPKDAYNFYQSEWTDKKVLHLFPHWNWKEGQDIDVWAYYNHADEVELFLNGQSLGVKSKEPGKYHVMWRVKYQPGTIKAISRKGGNVVLEKEIHTAGEPAKIELSADRENLKANDADLSFITVKITDKDGNMVPDAENLVHFNVEGAGFIAGVDNGCQTSMESFKANYRKAYNGMCLLIVQTKEECGEINVEAQSAGLFPAGLVLKVK